MPKPSLSPYQHLHTFKLKRQLCDVKIKIQDSFIHAHRVVLAATCPYFKAMFIDTFFQEHGNNEITIQGLDFETVQNVIDCLYLQDFSINLDYDNCQNYLEAASFLQIAQIKRLCERFFMKNIDASNAVQIYALADSYPDCKNLLKVCHKFIRKNFDYCYINEFWSRLELDLILSILKSRDLDTKSEERIFLAGLSWLRADSHPVKKTISKHRAKFAPEIMECLDLNIISPAFLTAKIQNETIIKQNYICREMINDFKMKKMSKSEMLLEPRKFKPSYCLMTGGFNRRFTYHENSTSISGKTWYVDLNEIQQKDAKVNQVPELHTPRFSHKMVQIYDDDLNILAIGGHDGKNYLSSVERFSWHDKRWHLDIRRMNSKRSCFGASAVNLERDQRIYVVGGQNENGTIESCEFYSSIRKTWTFCASLKYPRLGLSVSNSPNNRFIYAVGGSSSSENSSYLNYIECYNVHENIWTDIHDLKVPRKHCTTAVVQNELYVLGGNSEEEGDMNSVSVYQVSLLKNSLELVRETNTVEKRVGSATVVHDDSVIIFGGRGDRSVEVGFDGYFEKCEFRLPDTLVGFGVVSFKPP